MEFWYRVFMLCGGEKKTKPQIVNNEKEEKKVFVDSQFSVASNSLHERISCESTAKKVFQKNFSKKASRQVDLSYPRPKKRP